MSRIANFIKYSQPIYALYFYIGSFVLGLLKLFVRVREDRILFMSFGGKKYDDSPRSIYLRMIEDERFGNKEIIWIFDDPASVEIPRGRKIKNNTFAFILAALSSKIWIHNSSVERGLSFKQKETINFNTWHGTPIKKMGTDIAGSNKSFRSKSSSRTDIMLAQGAYEADIFSRVFRIPRSDFRIVGLPRNDGLVNTPEERIMQLKAILEIPEDKRVILYAPTFREYDKNDSKECVLDLPVDFSYWREILGGEYVLLFRAHYEIVKQMQFREDGFCRDMSGYPVLSDLMLVSDVLVSDYSSIFFDYSVMHKPMLGFTYDYDRYARERGMYFDIREEIDCFQNETELVAALRRMDVSVQKAKTIAFQEKFVTAFGHASEQAVNIITQYLHNA